MKNKRSIGWIGLITGIINGLFGAGGGMILVPALCRRGLSQHKSQATALCVILPLSALSLISYFFAGNISRASFLVVLGAAPGGLAGAWLMGKLSEKWLGRIFALLMLFAGLRMLLG